MSSLSDSGFWLFIPTLPSHLCKKESLAFPWGWQEQRWVGDVTYAVGVCRRAWDAIKDAGATQSLCHTSDPVNWKEMTIDSEPQAPNRHQIAWSQPELPPSRSLQVIFLIALMKSLADTTLGSKGFLGFIVWGYGPSWQESQAVGTQGH